MFNCEIHIKQLCNSNILQVWQKTDTNNYLLGTFNRSNFITSCCDDFLFQCEGYESNNNQGIDFYEAQNGKLVKIFSLTESSCCAIFANGVEIKDLCEYLNNLQCSCGELPTLPSANIEIVKCENPKLYNVCQGGGDIDGIFIMHSEATAGGYEQGALKLISINGVSYPIPSSISATQNIISIAGVPVSYNTAFIDYINAVLAAVGFGNDIKLLPPDLDLWNENFSVWGATINSAEWYYRNSYIIYYNTQIISNFEIQFDISSFGSNGQYNTASLTQDKFGYLDKNGVAVSLPNAASPYEYLPTPSYKNYEEQYNAFNRNCKKDVLESDLPSANRKKNPDVEQAMVVWGNYIAQTKTDTIESAKFLQDELLQIQKYAQENALNLYLVGSLKNGGFINKQTPYEVLNARKMVNPKPNLSDSDIDIASIEKLDEKHKNAITNLVKETAKVDFLQGKSSVPFLLTHKKNKK